jgi:hypothetical protein
VIYLHTHTHCSVYSGSLGGPIAAFRDERKIVLYVGAMTKPDIQLFTAAGLPLGHVPWDKGRIVTAAWTMHDQLLVVDEHGQVCKLGLMTGRWAY